MKQNEWRMAVQGFQPVQLFCPSDFIGRNWSQKDLQRQNIWDNKLYDVPFLGKLLKIEKQGKQLTPDIFFLFWQNRQFIHICNILQDSTVL